MRRLWEPPTYTSRPAETCAHGAAQGAEGLIFYRPSALATTLSIRPVHMAGLTPSHVGSLQWHDKQQLSVDLKEA